MGQWHIDQECESALIRLNDALCTFERNTGRRYTLILVPKASDEQIHLSQSGKPLPSDFGMSPREVLEIAMHERENP
ncbi:MAG: hypothetical protein HY340_00450 [Candidatus Kerfeldbacteria bacterium]|nr:hypothetical protein [Candidatus Kerfeldbacteria bacterium]